MLYCEVMKKQRSTKVPAPSKPDNTRLGTIDNPKPHLGRPITINGKKLMVFRIDLETWDKVLKQADRLLCSPSDYIRRAIHAELNRN